MSTIFLISLLILGIAGIMLQFKKKFNFLDFYYLLVFISISIWSTSFYSDDSVGAVYGVIAVIALNFGVSKIEMLRKPVYRVIIPLISMLSFIFFFRNEVIVVLGDSYLFVNKFLVLGVLFAVLGFEIANIKAKVLGNIYKGLDPSEMIQAILILLVGLSIFLGHFAATSFGMLVVTAGFLSSSYYRNDNSSGISVSYLGLMILPLLGSVGAISDVSLLSGDVLEGFFVGAFCAYFITKVFDTEKPKFIGGVLAYLISFLLLMGVLLLGMMYSSMGGMDAFIGAIVGISLINVVIGKGYNLASLLLIVIVIGSLVPKIMVNEDLAEFNAINNNEMVIEGEQLEEEKFIELDQLIGAFEIIKDSSRVSFTMGAKDETKGAFKKVSGEIVLDADINKSKLEVKLNLDDFTTFNKFRDGSLMDASYFNQKKYPELSYKSISFEKMDKFSYKVKGEFTMLGVSNPIEVTMKQREVNNRIVLIGNGVIDRTEFGMKPSATEGNIVTFQYNVELMGD